MVMSIWINHQLKRGPIMSELVTLKVTSGDVGLIKKIIVKSLDVDPWIESNIYICWKRWARETALADIETLPDILSSYHGIIYHDDNAIDFF